MPPDALADDAQDVREQAVRIVDAARTVAATECRSRERCFRLTRDVAATVRIMVDNLTDPALLDSAAVRPWLEAAGPGR